MYELAFNNNGERFELPSAAEFWRPRRVRDRGLEVVYRRDGIVPLIVPIDATAAEFRAEVGNTPGKYRLDALDANHQPIEGAPPAYVVIPRSEPPAPDTSAAAGAAPSGPATVQPGAESPNRDRAMSETAVLLEKIVNVNADLTRVIAERFASMMDSAAHLLRAADGAGMPARVPPEPRNALPLPDVRDEDDEDEENAEEDAEQGMAKRIENITRNIAHAAEAVAPLATMAFGKIGLRNAAAKKKALPRPAPRDPTAGHGVGPEPTRSPSRHAAASTTPAGSERASERSEASETGDEGTGPDDAGVALTPEMMARLVQIRSQLEPDEVEFVSQVYAELTPAEVAQWLGELGTLSIDEAVERIRTQIAGSHATPDHPNQEENDEEVAS